MLSVSCIFEYMLAFNPNVYWNWNCIAFDWNAWLFYNIFNFLTQFSSIQKFIMQTAIVAVVSYVIRLQMALVCSSFSIPFPFLARIFNSFILRPHIQSIRLNSYRFIAFLVVICWIWNSLINTKCACIFRFCFPFFLLLRTRSTRLLLLCIFIVIVVVLPCTCILRTNRITPQHVKNKNR